jgi:hypothetical protein
MGDPMNREAAGYQSQQSVTKIGIITIIIMAILCTIDISCQTQPSVPSEYKLRYTSVSVR